MNRILQVAMEPGKTARRAIQIARGYFCWSPAGIERNAARLLAPKGLALIQIRYDHGSPRLRAKKRSCEKNVIFFTSYHIDEFWKIAIDAGLEPLAVSLSPRVANAYFFLKKGGSHG